ncbi:hypothetical protein J1N35_002038 [Gossypium stocksii]|uniref:Uncharacterized protein n=1 Tax=Gossypium stocksii TaxID=47602 RepID=A0A9D3WJU7_9ROSI|nr:hypothetical protein J1N35_002038 [Gossypium stocksii]
MEMPPVFKSIPYYISASDFFKLQSYSGIVVATSNQNVVALGVTVTQGEGDLPKLLVTSDHGSEAEIYLFGGCITS